MRARRVLSVLALATAALLNLAAAEKPAAPVTEPGVISVCADVVDLVNREARYRTHIDWGSMKRGDFYRFDLVAQDPTGGYYPQWRDQNSGPGLPDRMFSEVKSIYPLHFFVAGMTKAAADAYDARCRANDCNMQLNDPGVTLFQNRTVEIPSLRAAPTCKDGATLTALVIGAADYLPATGVGTASRGWDIGQLTTPEGDAQAVGASLARSGYSVLTLLNPTRAQLLEAVKAVGATTRPGPHKLVIYFAGHGAALANQPYLLTLDLNTGPGPRPDVSTELQHSAVSLSEILGLLPTATRGFNLVILDMCRNELATAADTIPGPAIATFAPRTAVVMAAAASRESYDLGSEGVRSAYAQSLMPRLDRPGEHLTSLFAEVAREVESTTSKWRDGPMQPHLYGALPEDDACIGPCQR